MFGAFFILLALAFGWEVSVHLPLALYRAEQMAYSLVLGLFISTWIVFIGVLCFGYTAGSWLGLVVVTAGVVALYWRKAEPKVLPLPKKDLWWWIIICTIFSLIIADLFYSHLLLPAPDGWYSAGATWGDLALHLSLISHFAAESHFSGQLPILYGAKLTYPFLIDFLSGLLVRSGWSLREALLLPSLLLGLSFIQLFFFLSLRLLKTSLAATLALALLLLNGSFGGLTQFWQDFQTSHIGFFEFLGQLPRDYSNIDQLNYHFTNSIAALLLPQRGYLFAFSLMVICLTLLWQAEKKKELLGPAAVLIGLIPFAHIHTFIVLMTLFTWLMLSYCWSKHRIDTSWSRAWALAAIIALPQLIWQLTATYQHGFIRFYFGWMRLPGASYWQFAWGNFGFLLLMLVVAIFSYRQFIKDIFWRQFLGVSLGIFIITNLILFQPYDYDNIKLIFYAYWGLVFFMAAFLSSWLGERWWKRVIASILLVGLLGTGILTLIREGELHYRLYSYADLAFAQAVRSTTPPDARILTSSRHNNPVPNLTGRPIMVGYPGWLWSYGLDYQLPAEVVKGIFSGSADAVQWLAQYHISYIAVSDDEKSQLGFNADFISQFPLVYSQNGWEMFKVQ